MVRRAQAPGRASCPPPQLTGGCACFARPRRSSTRPPTSTTRPGRGLAIASFPRSTGPSNPSSLLLTGGRSSMLGIIASWSVASPSASSTDSTTMRSSWSRSPITDASPATGRAGGSGHDGPRGRRGASLFSCQPARRPRWRRWSGPGSSSLVALLVAVLVTLAIAAAASSSPATPTAPALAFAVSPSNSPSGQSGVRPKTRVRAFGLGLDHRVDGDRALRCGLVSENRAALRRRAAGSPHGSGGGPGAELFGERAMLASSATNDMCRVNGG